MKKVKFSDYYKIPKSYYRTCISWGDIEYTLNRYTKNYNLKMNPDFQRGHVWQTIDKRKYIEWIISGGESGRDIYFNHPNWMGNYEGDMVLVDGLQRLTAVREFLKNKFCIFDNKYFYDFELIGGNYIPDEFRFYFNICKLKTKKNILLWYLAHNSCGIIHSNDELNKVKRMINEIDNKERENET